MPSPRPLALLIHAEPISREILHNDLSDELRWFVAANARGVPEHFDERPVLLLADADLEPGLNETAARFKQRWPDLRAVALASEGEAGDLPDVDVVLVKPVSLERIRLALRLVVRLNARGSGVHASKGDGSNGADADDVATLRVGR